MAESERRNKPFNPETYREEGQRRQIEEYEKHRSEAFDRGATASEATRYAREKSEAGSGVPEGFAGMREEQAGMRKPRKKSKAGKGSKGMKKGGKVKRDRRDGIALRGKTRA
jgi:hypothetical protein